jgi:RES domain-containing protein
MKVYRISKCQYIDDLSCTGAANYSGRWHSKGIHILYTAASPSLALLESVAHISNIIVSFFCMICLDVPEDKIYEIKVIDLPDNWYTNPFPDFLKSYGDRFIAENKFFGLKVPSVIMPEESNILLNP